MKKNLLSLFILTCVMTMMSASAAFANVTPTSIAQNQQQADMYAQQMNYLQQQTEYLRQQTEALRQQNEALKQSQAYNQGYYEGQNQRYYHRDSYAPGYWLGGLCTGYVLGHWPTYRHGCHRCW